MPQSHCPAGLRGLVITVHGPSNMVSQLSSDSFALLLPPDSEVERPLRQTVYFISKECFSSLVLLLHRPLHVWFSWASVTQEDTFLTTNNMVPLPPLTFLHDTKSSQPFTRSQYLMLFFLFSFFFFFFAQTKHSHVISCMSSCLNGCAANKDTWVEVADLLRP